MRIIITEQQFNLILLDEGRKATDEEINERYLGIVKYWNDIYEKTGELISEYSTSHFLPSSSKINTDTNTNPKKLNPDYKWLNRNQLLPKFYIDTDDKQRQEKKQKEKKNKTYLDIVKYWNDIYEKTGELLFALDSTSHFLPSSSKKENPDYKWLNNNQLLPKFYIDTDDKQRQEKKQKEKKNKTYLDIVKYWNNIYKKTGELLNTRSTSHFLPSRSKKENPDYRWLHNNDSLDKFYIDTKHKQRQEEIKQNEYKRLVDKYKNNPETFNTKSKDYVWLKDNEFSNKF
jgi:hypothetical protein